MKCFEFKGVKSPRLNGQAGALLNKSKIEVTLFHAIRGFSIFESRFEPVIILTLKKDWLQEVRMNMKPVFEKARKRLIDSGFGPKRITTKLIEGARIRAGAIVEEARKGG